MTKFTKWSREGHIRAPFDPNSRDNKTEILSLQKAATTFQNMEWNMAVIVFLFGSLLGTSAAVMQLVLGFEFMAALQTYAFCAIALPLLTLLALAARRGRDTTSIS
ncbi:hypothetical protein [Cognatishimia activa]|uniref:hypothetical protein n=1 Tax=Cognatishimia activa TaxID=1715691 RepID=UPI0022327B94|nr:hypothetical protein [Cognatishimia activa]UZD90027.1 hypothetical protein M0D42_10540 [Cognatishimia activa]